MIAVLLARSLEAWVSRTWVIQMKEIRERCEFLPTGVEAQSMLEYIRQDFPEEKKSVGGIGSHNYGGWKVPQSDILETRTVRNIISSDSKVLRTRGVNGVCPSLRVGEDEMSQLNRWGKRKREQMPPSSIFVLFRPSGDWTMSSVLVHLGSYAIDWRRKQWHPTPVLLPGKSHGRRSLVGCSPWDR